MDSWRVNSAPPVTGQISSYRDYPVAMRQSYFPFTYYSYVDKKRHTFVNREPDRWNPLLQNPQELSRVVENQWVWAGSGQRGGMNSRAYSKDKNADPIFCNAPLSTNAKDIYNMPYAN